MYDSEGTIGVTMPCGVETFVNATVARVGCGFVEAIRDGADIS